jgi:hypothetical protein
MFLFRVPPQTPEYISISCPSAAASFLTLIMNNSCVNVLHIYSLNDVERSSMTYFKALLHYFPRKTEKKYGRGEEKIDVPGLQSKNGTQDFLNIS